MEQDLKMEKIILTKFGIAPQFKNRNISIRFIDSEVPNTEVKERTLSNRKVLLFF